jgi:hypothetical protein
MASYNRVCLDQAKANNANNIIQGKSGDQIAFSEKAKVILLHVLSLLVEGV